MLNTFSQLLELINVMLCKSSTRKLDLNSEGAHNFDSNILAKTRIEL